MAASRFLSLVAAGAAAFLLQASPVRGEPWLHIKVLEHGASGETVRVNVPVSLAGSILPIVQQNHGSHFRLDQHDLTPEQLRQILVSVRDAQDGQYISVDGVDEKVRIEKSEGRLHIKVDEKQGDHVEMTLRLEVLDALLSGPADELNLTAALNLLRPGEELVRVEGEDETVRIWVDEKNVSD